MLDLALFGVKGLTVLAARTEQNCFIINQFTHSVAENKLKLHFDKKYVFRPKPTLDYIGGIRKHDLFFLWCCYFLNYILNCGVWNE